MDIPQGYRAFEKNTDWQRYITTVKEVRRFSFANHG